MIFVKKLFKQYTNRIARWVLRLFIVLIVLFAILITCARFFTPLLNQHKQLFENWAAQILKQPVKVDAVHVAFQGQYLLFNFKHVQILPEQQNSIGLQAKQLTIGVNLLSSLWHGDLVTSHIGLQGVQLQVVDDKEKGLYINVFPLAKASHQNNNVNFWKDAAPIINWLVLQKRVDLQDIHLSWKMRSGDQFNIPDLSLTFISQANQHELQVEGHLDGKVNQAIKLLLSIRGTPHKLTDLQGQAYLSASNFPLSDWLKRYQWHDLRLQNATLDMKSWLTMKHGQFTQVQSVFDLQHGLLRNGKAKKLNIERFSGQINWQRSDDYNWQMIGQQLQLTLDKRALPPAQFGIKVYERENDASWQLLVLKNLQLHSLTSLLQFSKIVPDTIKLWWQRLQAHGLIKQLQLLHQGAGEQAKISCPTLSMSAWMPAGLFGQFPIVSDCRRSTNDYVRQLFMRAQFEQLQTQAWKDYPGIENISGELIVTPEQGRLNLDSQQGSISANIAYDHPLAFDTLTSIITWHVLSTDKKQLMKYPRRPPWSIEQTSNQLVQPWLQVRLHQLFFQNPAIRLLIQAQVDMDRGFKSPHLAAIAWLDQADSRRIKDLLPGKILGKNLDHWLKQAFFAGKGLKSLIVFRGDMDKFPFPEYQGQFIADTQINDIELNFDEAWPTIKHLSANLVFHNAIMSLAASKAHFFDWNIPILRATIDDILHDHAKLNVYAAWQPTAQTLLNLIAKTPLNEDLSGLSKLHLQGSSPIKLQLDIPLDNKPMQVKGIIQFPKNELQVPDYDIALKVMSGKLQFVDDKVSGRFMGQLLNHPAKIDIQTHYDKTLKKNIQHVVIDSKVKAQQVQQRFDFHLLHYLQGQFDYQAKLSFYAKYTRLTMSSNLQGLSVDWPAPYAKTAQQNRVLDLTAQFRGNNTNLKINYGEQIDTQLLFHHNNNGDQLTRGNIVFGGGQVTLPKTNQLTIQGFLPNFNWEIWQPYLKAWQDKDKKSGSTSSPSQQQSGLFPDINLRLGHLHILGQSYTGVNATASHQSEAWHIAFDQARIKGQVILPDNFPAQALQANFETLYWKTEDNKLESGKTSSDNNKELSPKDIPPFTLDVKQFYYAEQPVGSIYLAVQPQANDLHIRQLDIKSTDASVQLQGDWRQLENSQRTYLQGQVDFNNMGKFLNSWDISDYFSNGKGKIKFDLNWSNTPYDIMAKGLNGVAHIDLSDGQVVNLDEETNMKLGLGKVVNVLGIDSILRMGDLTKSGYSYSSFAGDFEFKQGNIYTENTVADGPVAKISIKGGLGLVSRDYDLKLAVRPYLTSSLPLVATLIGGPIVGAATFVADKLVSPIVGEAAGSQYHLQGKWDTPEVKSIESK